MRALEPDNIEAPPHIRVHCWPSEALVKCRIEVAGCEDPRRIMTLRNTVDEIMVLVKAVEEAIGNPREGRVN